MSGFRRRRHRLAKEEIHPGDYLICYLTGLSRFIGVLEVKSEAYEDDTPIWEDAVFPIRFVAPKLKQGFLREFLRLSYLLFLRLDLPLGNIEKEQRGRNIAYVAISALQLRAFAPKIPYS